MKRFVAVVLGFAAMVCVAAGAVEQGQRVPTPAAPAAERPAADPAEEPELKFAQDGQGLLVSMTLTVNNSDHVLITDSWAAPGKEALLTYCLIQNRDLLVRSRKRIEVQWRLIGREQEGQRYEVTGSVVQLKSVEIEALGTGLQDLARKGERARPPKDAK